MGGLNEEEQVSELTRSISEIVHRYNVEIIKVSAIVKELERMCLCLVKIDVEKVEGL